MTGADPLLGMSTMAAESPSNRERLGDAVRGISLGTDGPASAFRGAENRSRSACTDAFRSSSSCSSPAVFDLRRFGAILGGIEGGGLLDGFKDVWDDSKGDESEGTFGRSGFESDGIDN